METMNIQLEVVARGIMPNDKSKISELAKDADTTEAVVMLHSQRLKAITEYVIHLKNKYNGKKAIVNYFRAARELVDVEGNGHVDHCPLPTRQEWRDADNSSMAAMMEYQAEFQRENVQRDSEQSAMRSALSPQMTYAELAGFLNCVDEFNRRHPLFVSK